MKHGYSFQYIFRNTTNMFPSSYVFILFLITVSNCYGQNYSMCSNYLKCGTCIQNPACAWCNEPKNSIHCQSKDAISCSKDLQDPETNVSIIQDDPLSWDIDRPMRQIKPQRMTIQLRKKQPQTIRFQFVRAWNELDAYFLLDNSKTMETHIRVLSKLSEQLVKEMESLTKSFRLGFGSFVEKNEHPFAYHRDAIVDIQQAYSFRNHLSLTSNTAEFKSKVSGVNFSGNVDGPEGGLEALVQALTCTDEIGWSKQSSHLIIFSSDGPFHISGDGKLVGASRPNDGKCHTNDGIYDASQNIDYPSTSQLGQLIHDHNKFVLFAIVGCENNAVLCENYQKLVNNLPNSNFTRVDKYSHSFSDVINVIKETYNKILTSAQFTNNIIPGLDVKYRVRCTPTSDFVDGSSCRNLKIGEVIDLEVILNARSCLQPLNSQLKIHPAGVEEFLNINIEVFCDCDCEKDHSKNPADCEGNGDKICGLCSCRDGFSGKKCQCSGNLHANMVDDKLCVDPETNTTCAGSGICLCGDCTCDKNVYGKYCKCRDDTCPQVQGRLCSGKGHGTCECGRCNCLSGYTGDDCSCTVSTISCLPPDSEQNICSDQGQCKCGQCECNKGYYGQFCEDCIDCDRCSSLAPCVKAFLDNNTITESCTQALHVFEIKKVPQNSLDNSDLGWKKCVLFGDFGCSTQYRYKQSGGSLLPLVYPQNFHQWGKIPHYVEKTRQSKTVYIEVEPESCSFIASPLGIMVILTSAIAIGGLIALLIWKMVVEVVDKREFARFQERRKGEMWHTGNPLYKPAVNEFQNPTYMKND